MQCYNTLALDIHLSNCDRIVEEERYLDYLAREEAEKILEIPLPNDRYDLVMEFIYDNDHFINSFDQCIYSLNNNASVESVQKLQKFLFEMAYEMARKEIAESRRKNGKGL